MDQPIITMTQQIAQAASAFEQQRTGHAPTGVTVVLSEDTLVITLRGGLSEVEKALARCREGAAQVQGFHRLLFTSSADSLWREINRITGVEVCEATAEVDSATGTVLHAFTTGTIVQVFLLAQRLPPESWSSSDSVNSDDFLEAQRLSPGVLAVNAACSL
jgi:uncharacterized protein YbcI